MSNYIPIGQHQVTNFIQEKAQIEAAAHELFKAYTEALPDKDDWHGAYGWRSECGSIEIDETGLEYHVEYFAHGDNESFYLNLPLSALYDPHFIENAKVEWAEVKEKSAAQNASGGGYDKGFSDGYDTCLVEHELADDRP